MEQKVTVLESWRWGALSAASWAGIIYLLSVLVLGALRLGHGFPLYTNAEYITGSYPLIWFVYIYLPLLARDTYLFCRGRLSEIAEFKWLSLALLLSSLLAYRYIFGWLY